MNLMQIKPVWTSHVRLPDGTIRTNQSSESNCSQGNYVDAIIWTFAEPAAGIISCSIPASAYFFGKVFKRIGLSFTSVRTSTKPKQLYNSSFGRRGKSQDPHVGGSFARLREDHKGGQPEYPMNDIAVSVDSGNSGIARDEHEAPERQIRVTEDVELIFESTDRI